ncbi:hypothetical protein P7C70_g8082, partial [Phenoliferia sp. Uapishka_3]
SFSLPHRATPTRTPVLILDEYTPSTFLLALNLPSTHPFHGVVPNRSPADSLTHMVHSWDADAWERYILLLPVGVREPFLDIPRQIREGFTLGIRSVVEKTFSPPNRLSADDPLNAVITKYILKELLLGRLDGPYTPAQFEADVGPYRTAPLNVAPKGTTLPGEPLKWRIVENPAFPYEEMADGTRSINSELDASEFQCTWIKLRTCQDLFRSLPPEAVVMGTDMADGFHHIPLAWEVRKHFCLSHQGLVFTRKVGQFGVTTTPGVFGITMDATSAILRHLIPNICTLNQVDDLLVVFLDPLTQDSSVLDILAELGWVTNEKGWKRARQFTFMGIDWDLDALTMTIPDRKRQKYLARVDKALHYATYNVPVDLSFVESLIGSLMYVSYVIPLWKSDLYYLLAFRHGFSNQGRKKRFSKDHFFGDHGPLFRSLKLWKEHLSSDIISSSYALPLDIFGWDLSSDACDEGMGIVATPYESAEGYAFHVPLPAGWKDIEGLHIGPAEGWAVELLLDAAIALDVHDCTVELWCDNDGFSLSFPKGYSRNKAQNDSIARMNAKAAARNIRVLIPRISTHDNPADSVSRGEVDLSLYRPFPFALSPVLPSLPSDP